MLIFQPEGVSYINKEGESVLESARNAGVSCKNMCGGRGTCGKCRVKVEIGEFHPVTKEEKIHFTKEELSAGYRLACCLYPKFWFKTCEILIEDEEEKRKDIFEKEGEGMEFFRKKAIDFGWCSIGGKENVDVQEENCQYGMAVDIGTTNIEALLWNLQTGYCVARILRSNPQQKYGADVISRIAYSLENKENFQKLCNLLRDAISEIADIFLEEVKSNSIRHTLEKVTVVGNAVMMHFYAGEDVSKFAKAPYQSSYKEGRCMEGNIFGIKGAKVYLLPNIESFVGADTTGVMLYLDNMYHANNIGDNLPQKEEFYGERTVTNQKILIIDIGTNGEIILQVNGKNYVSSTSAGPAFEGAAMVYGMRAENGAITGISLDDKEYFLQVIGEERPRGICGSGLIEIVAKFCEKKIIREDGYMLTRQEAKLKGLPDTIVSRLRESEFGTAFELYKDEQGEVLLTQKDIRELQLAKGAIVAGVNTLLIKYNLKPSDVDKCYLAGAFGTYLDGECAKRIGLLPISAEKMIPVGNGALMGACRGLMEEEGFALAEKMAAETVHISLSEENGFREEYIKGMDFGRN